MHVFCDGFLGAGAVASSFGQVLDGADKRNVERRRAAQKPAFSDESGGVVLAHLDQRHKCGRLPTGGLMQTRLLIPSVMLATILWGSPVSAASITFESIVQSSTELWVDVHIVGVEDLVEPNTDLYGFDFFVSFASSAFSSDLTLSIVEGDFLAKSADPSSPPKPTFPPVFAGDLASGAITVFSTLVTEVPGATQDGMLARLIFSGARLDDPSILVSNANLARFIEGSPFAELVPVTAVEITPQPVPEPSTLGLLGIGLAAMARRMRRRTPVTQSIERSAH